MATLQCDGHRRDELATVGPIPGEILWGAAARRYQAGVELERLPE
jgi:hypothetical protein